MLSGALWLQGAPESLLASYYINVKFVGACGI